MSARELVMAVLCRPLSNKDLLLAEKVNNVIIHRKMEFDPEKDASTIDAFMKSIRHLPLKLMFIFSLGDIIIVNSPDDLSRVIHRLVAL